MMTETDEPSPIFSEQDRPPPDDSLNTTDEIGPGDDLNQSREMGAEGEQNSSTDALHSDAEGAREEDLNDSDDIPEINSKLSLKEEPAPEPVAETETNGVQQKPPVRKSSEFVAVTQAQIKPVEIKPVHIGDQKLRAKLKFEVVTAKVVEEQGKKHVTYTVMMKRASEEKHPAVICRRYNDFCYLYERILCTFHPSILGEFQFPKKVLIGNFKAEVITERTDAFHKFLNLIAQNDKLLYSEYFHAFLCSDEQNEAVSNIKLAKYGDAAPLLEVIFYIREKLVTICHVSVLECLIELVACLAEVESYESAFRYCLVSAQSLQLLHGHPEVERVKVPFLKLAVQLASSLGHDPRPYNKQLSELRYSGVKTDHVPTLMDVVRKGQCSSMTIFKDKKFLRCQGLDSSPSQTDLSLFCKDGVTYSHQYLLGRHSEFLRKVFLASSPLRSVRLLQCPGLPYKLQEESYAVHLNLFLPDFSLEVVQAFLTALLKGETVINKKDFQDFQALYEALNINESAGFPDIYRAEKEEIKKKDLSSGRAESPLDKEVENREVSQADNEENPNLEDIVEIDTKVQEDDDKESAEVNGNEVPDQNTNTEKQSLQEVDSTQVDEDQLQKADFSRTPSPVESIHDTITDLVDELLDGEEDESDFEIASQSGDKKEGNQRMFQDCERNITKTSRKRCNETDGEDDFLKECMEGFTPDLTSPKRKMRKIKLNKIKFNIEKNDRSGKLSKESMVRIEKISDDKLEEYSDKRRVKDKNDKNSELEARGSQRICTRSESRETQSSPEVPDMPLKDDVSDNAKKSEGKNDPDFKISKKRRKKSPSLSKAEVENTEEYECPIKDCKDKHPIKFDERYPRIYYFLKHVIQIHFSKSPCQLYDSSKIRFGNQLKYKCSYCDKINESSNSMFSHMALKHDDLYHKIQEKLKGPDKLSKDSRSLLVNIDEYLYLKWKRWGECKDKDNNRIKIKEVPLFDERLGKNYKSNIASRKNKKVAIKSKKKTETNKGDACEASVQQGGTSVEIKDDVPMVEAENNDGDSKERKEKDNDEHIENSDLQASVAISEKDSEREKNENESSQDGSESQDVEMKTLDEDEENNLNELWEISENEGKEEAETEGKTLKDKEEQIENSVKKVKDSKNNEIVSKEVKNDETRKRRDSSELSRLSTTSAEDEVDFDSVTITCKHCEYLHTDNDSLKKHLLEKHRSLFHVIPLLEAGQKHFECSAEQLSSSCYKTKQKIQLAKHLYKVHGIISVELIESDDGWKGNLLSYKDFCYSTNNKDPFFHDPQLPTSFFNSASQIATKRRASGTVGENVTEPLKDVSDDSDPDIIVDEVIRLKPAVKKPHASKKKEELRCKVCDINADSVVLLSTHVFLTHVQGCFCIFSLFP